MSACLLIHDLGTSGCKSCLFTPEGVLLADAVAEYPTFSPAPGWVEQRAEDWWSAVCSATRALLDRSGVSPREILGISFSGMMMGCLPVDTEGTPLRNALIWADTRAQAEERFFLDAVGMERVYQITGHRASASYTACKWLWIRHHEPDIAARTAKLLHTKDYLLHRMTGRFVTDPSDASGTNLLDLRGLCWSRELLDALSISPDLLPEILPSASVASSLLPEAAEACGLIAGIPVITGGGDGSCACAGAGALHPGDAYMALGTSSWISTVSSAPRSDPAMRSFTWAHLDPSLVTPCGTMQASGASFQWFRQVLQAEDDALNTAAAQSAPGAGGVLFLPYLLGERSPRWDHLARGAFVGLSQTTSRADLTRAVMEGIAMNLRLILDAVSGEEKPAVLSTIGGGAVPPVFAQILADVLEVPLSIPESPRSATALGAAICAAVALGILPDFGAAATWNRPHTQYMPSPDTQRVYTPLRSAFEDAWEGLRRADIALDRIRKGALGA